MIRMTTYCLLVFYMGRFDILFESFSDWDLQYGDGMFSDGTFSDGTFSNGTFSDGTFFKTGSAPQISALVLNSPIGPDTGYDCLLNLQQILFQPRPENGNVLGLS